MARSSMEAGVREAKEMRTETCSISSISSAEASSSTSEPSEKQTSYPAGLTPLKTIISSANRSTSSRTSPEPAFRAWRPSLLRLGPVAGLSALLIAFCQIFVSYAILKGSDGALVSSWKYQPTVYLAILTAISNKALAFAVVQGTVVTFWLRALQGTTLGHLHRDWAYGLHAYKALSAGKHFNLLALACICATFVAMDGPLLQRASSVSNVAGLPIELEVSLTPEVPAYFTGRALYGEDGYYGGYDTSAEWLPVMQDYLSKRPIQNAISGCPGTCTATVQGPAFAVTECNTILEYKNYSRPMSRHDQNIWNKYHVETFDALNDTTVFQVFLATRNGTSETVELVTRISDNEVAETCSGHLKTVTCSLVSAIAEYDVVIIDGFLTFERPPSSPKIVAFANNTAITDQTIDSNGLKVMNRGVEWIKTTLSGIAGAAYLMFGVQETIGVWPNDPKSGALLYPSPSPFAFEYFANYLAWGEQGTACAPLWNDPRSDIMAALNELAFRTGVYAATHYDEAFLRPRIDDNLPIYYNISGIQKTALNVFRADMNYFAGAAAVELLTILIVLFTLYGFWRLGRAVTLSPLEIAKAFDSPLLLDTDSNYNGRDIARFEGTRTIQYGALNASPAIGSLESSSGEDKLVMAERGKVRQPTGRMLTLQEYWVMLRSGGTGAVRGLGQASANKQDSSSSPFSPISP